MKISEKSAEKLILALDGMDRDEALQLIYRLPGLKWVKVGLELFVAAGPEILVDLREKGLRVFLDLKFHDIPSTMAAACFKAAALGAELITVHACAGSKALADAHHAALKGALELGLPAPILLGVTVLTSWDQKQFSKELLFVFY